MSREKTLFKFFCEYLNYPYILFMTAIDYNNVLHKKRKKFILLRYLPIMATSGQRPLSSVPEVAVLERFDTETSAFYTYFCIFLL